MKKILVLVTLFASLFQGSFMSSCSNTDSGTGAHPTAVRSEVQQMVESIAKDISTEGPVAWLRYFENTSGFFMASEGALAFPNFDSAKNFINNTLVKSISKIELQWSNIRIDSLTKELANVAAIFHEDISLATGEKLSENGYFTAVAHQTQQGWKLHNAHWSTVVDKQKQ